MDEKSIGNSNNPDFRTSIPEYSDDEILNILKKRSQYQPDASGMAIVEAIKRGLINSEQDLFAEEFKEKSSLFSLFPSIEKDRIRNKTRKSIARGLLIIGVIPVVWGVLEITKTRLIEGVLLILLGSIWMFASTKIMSEYSSKMIAILFILLAASVAYIIKLMLQMKGLVLMDFVIPFVLCSLISYGLLFIRKLNE